MIPKSTHYQVHDANGKILFAGNKADMRKFYNQNKAKIPGIKKVIA